jgi:uncharacterized protein YdaU (DUF1376 family)
MNYYEHHLGDYAKDTAHLSMIEHGAYRILLDAYYTREVPLPTDRRACYKLARAQSKDERAAVDYVIEEFFIVQETGIHHARCDAEIFRFKDKQAKAKRSAEARWNKQQTHSDGNANASADAMRTHSEGSAPRARSSRQSPVASNQSTNPLPQSVSCTQPELREQPPASTRKGQVCGLLRKAGMADAAPHYLDDATWEAILGKRTNEEIVEVALAKMAARPNQRTGLKYIAPALLEDPAPIAANARASPGFVSQRDQQRQEVIEVLTGKNRTHERTEPAAIDAECQRLAG